jgi:hypothetical protein
MAGMIFYMVSTQSNEEREGKERKKIKVFLGQTMLNHYTRHHPDRKGRQDESNDVAKSRLQSLKLAVHAAGRRRNG